MRHRRIWPPFLLGAAFAAGCGTPSGPTNPAALVEETEPSCGQSTAATPVTARGSFPVKPSVSSSGDSSIDTTYRAWVGETALTGVEWVDERTLTALVPAGIAVGTYGFAVESPFGDRAAKEAAFEIRTAACRPVLDVVLSIPASIDLGDFTVTMSLSNVGGGTATAVTADVPSIVAGGTAEALFKSGPEGSPSDLPSGQPATLFSWIFTATTPGTLALSSTAHGTDGATGEQVHSETAASNEAAVAAGLTISPTSATVTAGGTPVTFTATLSSALPGSDVAWSLSSNLGTLSAHSGPSVTYTPPAAGSVSSATPVTLTASVAGLDLTAQVQITVNPAGPSLAISPAAVTVTAGGAATRFTATLLRATGTIRWSLSPNVGRLSANTGSSVTYTPPAAITARTAVTLAASVANPSLRSRAQITVNPPAPSLTISPTAATVRAGGAATSFTATLSRGTGTIQWSLSPNVGGLSATTGTRVNYTPPSTVSASTPVTLTASVPALSVSSQARVTLQP